MQGGAGRGQGVAEACGGHDSSPRPRSAGLRGCHQARVPTARRALHVGAHTLAQGEVNVMEEGGGRQRLWGCTREREGGGRGQEGLTFSCTSSNGGTVYADHAAGERKGSSSLTSSALHAPQAHSDKSHCIPVPHPPPVRHHSRGSCRIEEDVV